MSIEVPFPMSYQNFLEESLGKPNSPIRETWCIYKSRTQKVPSRKILSYKNFVEK